MNTKFAFILAFCCLFINFTYAQGGGPPMLTDDPETPDARHFEINTSINSEITNQQQFSVPLLDMNYGANDRTQLKVQIPYYITSAGNKKDSGSLGYPLIGVKYRFLDQAKDSVSVSTYPQILVAGNQSQFILPIELQKSIGRFTIGEEIGYFFIESKSQNLLNGNLLGFNISGKAEILVEFYLDHNFTPTTHTDGYINYGFRYTFNKTFTLLASCGTQIITPSSEQKQYFFSFLGLQTLF
jgi:hypothetical protein